MEMTNQRRKQLWIGGTVAAVLYFAPGIMNYVRHMLIVPNRGYVAEKPHAAIPMVPAQGFTPQPAMTGIPAAGGAPTLANTPADPKFVALLGKYMGGAILKTRECKANFELKPNQDKPEEFSGFVTIVCYRPFTQKGAMPFLSTDPVTALGTMSTPASAILSGPVVNGSIRMKADKSIETLADGCPITGLSVVPFATNQIEIDWEEGTCPGGQLIMQHE